jgi:hypothetical protein
MFTYRGHVMTEPPAVEPVTLAEVKARLALDGTADDAMLLRMITEARQEFEDATGLALITQEWRLSLDRWPGGREPWWDGTRQMAISELSGVPGFVPMPRYPLEAIDDVTVYDTSGAATVVDVASTFDIDVYQTPGRMVLKFGKTWPIALRPTDAIRVDYTAGYGPASENVPAPIRRAIEQMVAYMYSHRGDLCEAGDAYIESGARAIAARYMTARI